MHRIIFQLFNTLSIVSPILTTTKYIFCKNCSYNKYCSVLQLQPQLLLLHEQGSNKRTDSSSAFNNGTSQGFFFFISSETKYKNKHVYSCLKRTQIKEIIFTGVADTAFAICTMQLQNKFRVAT